MTPDVAHRTRICWQNTGDRVAAGFRTRQRLRAAETRRFVEREAAGPGIRFARPARRTGIKYSDGRKFCFKVPGVNMVCRTTIAGTFETGQSAVRIDLIEREGDKATRLQLFLPVGLYLQAGVKLTVDTAGPIESPTSGA
jgi:invasion protein IalB